MASKLRARTLRVAVTDAEIAAEMAIDADAASLDEPGGLATADIEAVPADEGQAKTLRESGPSAAVQQRLEGILKRLEGDEGRDARARKSDLRAQVESFEKDDDANGHMAFITAASNLRAASYGIPPADLHRSKLIAGRIVPAIATTTACVVGLSGLELLKLARDERDMGHYRNAFLNLALPLVAFSEPSPAEEFQMPGDGEPWTLWSRIDVEPSEDVALKELVALLEAKLGLELSLLSVDGMTIYSSLAPPAQQRAWMGMPVRAVVQAAKGGQIRSQTIRMQASCYDEEQDEDVDVPVVAYRVARTSSPDSLDGPGPAH